MSRPRILWAALILGTLVPALAFAGPGFGPRGDRGARGLFPPPGYLELSEEQLEATRAILEGFRAEAGTLRDTHRALREDLRALLDGDDPDAAEVGRIVIDLHDESGQFRALRESAETEFEALLTAEQLVKWENFKELRAARHEGRRNRDARGPRRGGGPRGPGGGGAAFGGPVSD